MTIDNQSIKKIAVLRALKIGDMLVSVPFFRALRSTFPKAEISLVGMPWAKNFAKRFNRYIDSFITFPGYPLLPERDYNLSEVMHFLMYMQQQQFDLFIQLQGDGSVVNPLVELCGAKLTAGFYPSFTQRPHSPHFFLYPYQLPEIKKNLFLLEQIGVPTQGDYLEFPLTKAEEKQFQTNFQKWGIKSNYALIHPGASVSERRWEIDKFIRAAKFLAGLNVPIVVTGSVAEKNLADLITQKVEAVNLAGQTDLAQLALLIKNSQLLIANDTSVSHLAAAFETPSVIISHLSPEETKRWRPLNHKLHRVVRAGTDDVSQVLDEIKQLMPIQRQSLLPILQLYPFSRESRNP